jgi:hypothetical protein
MTSQAKVTSIDALESLRAGVIIFMTKGHRAVDEMSDEIRRTRVWVQNDQRHRWELEVRKRQKVLDQAKQELMSAKMIRLRDDLSAQHAAVRKAERALEEAEGKLRNVRAWTRNFDGCVEPLAKRLEGLREFLAHDMPKAVAYLVQAQTTLESYTELAAPGAAPSPAESQAAVTGAPASVDIASGAAPFNLPRA